MKAQPITTTSFTCPACGHRETPVVAEPLEHSSFLRCSRCELQFVAPIPAECPIFVDFSAAGAGQFALLVGGAPLDPLLTPSERRATLWLLRRFRPGDAVFELCFEVGRFMEAGRRAGFKMQGCDPVAGHAALLSARGFEVRNGLVEARPSDWPAPRAVVVLESLVRFPDPVAVLADLKRRFPQAEVFVSVPSPNRSLKAPGFDRRSDYPPHHLTRWTALALQRAMEAAGYDAQVNRTYIDANSLEVPAPLRVLVRWAYRLIGEADYSLVAIGRPRE